MDREEDISDLRRFQPSAEVTIDHLRQWLRLGFLHQRDEIIERQVQILWGRYCAPGPRTWDDIAVEMGVSKKRVQEYADWALYCLRHPRVRRQIESSEVLVPGTRLWRAIYRIHVRDRWEP